MAAAYQAHGGDLPAVSNLPEGAPAAGTDAAELIAQIRQLAGNDPAAVQQVIADVLAALDRAAGGALRDQLPEGLPFGNSEPAKRPD
jgi:hypothetical protein